MPPKRKEPGSSSGGASSSSKKPKTTSHTLDTFFRPSTSPKKPTPTTEISETYSRGRSPGLQAGNSRLLPIVIDDDDSDEDSGKLLASRTSPVQSLSSASIPETKPRGASPPAEESNPLKATFNSPSKTIPDDISVTSYPDLGADPLLFSIQPCPWTSSKPAPYSFLAHVLNSLSQTKSRILLSNILTNALRFLIAYDPPSVIPSLYMVSNTIAPAYIPVELGLGSSVLSKALQSVSGMTGPALRKLYNTFGDSGDVAFAAKASVRTLVPHPPMSIIGVYTSMIKISKSKGTGATKQRQSIVERLLLSAKGEEVRYVMRTLSQNLRVGAVRTTILTALARAAVLTRPFSKDGEAKLDPSLADSPYFVSPEVLNAIQPLPDKKGKRKGDTVDEAREVAVVKMAAADALMRMVFVRHPSYDDIVNAFFNDHGGLEHLAENVSLTVGIPLHATLGSPTRSLDEVFSRLGDLPFAAEYKYDGQRAQVHLSYDPSSKIPPSVRIFSRHLEDMTDKYPDIVVLVQEYCSSGILRNQPQSHSFILDAEIVAWDSENSTTKSFQELSNRARKDVKLEDVKLPVCLFVFDLMYLNAKPLLSEPFRERRRLLHKHFPPLVLPSSKGGARLQHVESLDSDGPGGREEIEAFWATAIDSRCEGLMVKLLDSGEVIEEILEIQDDQGTPSGTPASPRKGKAKGTRRKPLPATYEPDKRTNAWLKLKKDYVDGVGDSLDLVPIGAWHGNGRKAAWWSPGLLAGWDPKLGRLVAVCKCMSGFSDTFYKALTERYPEGSETCSKVPLGDYEVGGLRPSVYFVPREVWEIRGAEITISPVSVAALGEISDARGLSLRFPRFIRVREDKRIEDATQCSFLADMWRRQAGKGKSEKMGGADDGELMDAIESESDVEEEDMEDK